MRLTLRFAYYTAEELTAVVSQRARALGWAVDEGAVINIAQRGRGTPRIALRLLESARRVCRANGDSLITEADVQRACQLDQLDELGLDQLEQQYLRVLAEQDRPLRLNVIAARLGLPPATITRVVESFLLRDGLILRTDAGRELTPRGRDHLRACGANAGGTT
jgi:Holliday junction DNA helicase RuvB